MAIFNKNNINPSVSETTVISAGARIEGQFYFDSMLHVDGELNGEIHSQSVVVIGKTGVVKGKLYADKIVVNGIFEGELDANNLEILMGGLVNGNILIKQIAIENGGRFNGNCKIKDEAMNLIENTSYTQE